mmetsp:Transcript_77860/g.251872  ORF Transcript_77860/g.251872 Transcript_77860/m.251872 type:complete len:288 (-) Transcript_77860:1067-1930(-)
MKRLICDGLSVPSRLKDLCKSRLNHQALPQPMWGPKATRRARAHASIHIHITSKQASLHINVLFLGVPSLRLRAVQDARLHGVRRVKAPLAAALEEEGAPVALLPFHLGVFRGGVLLARNGHAQCFRRRRWGRGGGGGGVVRGQRPVSCRGAQRRVLHEKWRADLRRCATGMFLVDGRHRQRHCVAPGFVGRCQEQLGAQELQEQRAQDGKRDDIEPRPLPDELPPSFPLLAEAAKEVVLHRLGSKGALQCRSREGAQEEEEDLEKHLLRGERAVLAEALRQRHGNT